MVVWIQNVILVVAVIAAIWYARETRKLRLQMIRPEVIFFLRTTSSKDILGSEDDFEGSVELLVKNVGEGTAINVQIPPIELKDGKLEPKPSALPVLEKAQEVPVSLFPSSGVQRDLSQILGSSRVALKLTASYRDVENTQFTTTTSVGPNAKPPFILDRRSNLLRRVLGG